jgi:hypothetical protein
VTGDSLERRGLDAARKRMKIGEFGRRAHGGMKLPNLLKKEEFSGTGDPAGQGKRP